MPKKSEANRIQGIPYQGEYPDNLVELMNNALKRPKGTMTLLRTQAESAWQLIHYGQLFGCLPVGSGKATCNSTLVPTPKGPIKIGDLKVGDFVFGQNGKPTRIKGVYPQGVVDLYRVTFKDGTESIACGEHLWSVRKEGSNWKTLNTLQIKGTLLRASGSTNWRVPMCKEVELPKADLPIDPWALGALLGDGSLKQGTPSFTNASKRLCDRLLESLPGIHCRWKQNPRKTAWEGYLSNKGQKTNWLTEVLRSMNLWGVESHTKHVPEQYLWASKEQRKALLQGLMDTDGCASKTGRTFSSTSENLAKSVQFLVRSLGGMAGISHRQTYFTYKGVKKPGKPSFRVSIKLPNNRDCFSSSCKASTPTSKYKNLVRSITDIEQVEPGLATCISVEAEDSLYLTEDFVVTHNTLVSQLAPGLLGLKRPLVLVRSALTAQWARDYVENQKHYVLHPNISVLSYHALSRESSTDFLYRSNFDGIIADEAHKVSRAEAGRTLKLWHYFMANQDCKFIPLSGTMTNKSIKEYWRLLALSLDENAPIPFKNWAEMEAVSSVIDASGRTHAKAEQTAMCGKIYNVQAEEGGQRYAAESTQTRMRKAYRDRLRGTPGVVMPTTNGLEMGLDLFPWSPSMPPEIKEAIDLMVSAAVAPNGQLIDNHLETYQWQRQILAGFYYEFVWPNGEIDHKWRDARSAWFKLASKDIGVNRMYTEAEVRAHYAANFPDDPTYIEWNEVESLKPEPPRRVTWINDIMVRKAVEKLNEEKEGILWFEHKAVGEKLRELGVHVYDESDADIDQTISPKRFAASLGSHSEGRNLQRYEHHLVFSPQPSGKGWEQLLGRSHRTGCTHDVLTFTVAQYHDHFKGNMKNAWAGAVYVEESTGMQQRLMQATWIDIEKE